MSETTVDHDAILREIEQYRGELTGYCYRMLGSPFEAEDAVQETMTRAWRAADRFEGRSSLRTWLYRIASNVCFDALNARQRRARPMDLGGPGTVDTPLGAPLIESTWIEPIPNTSVLTATDPAEQAIARESIKLAFVAALQFLPPKQRAVLILREVLRWEATEVAALLETTVASVNSALQRARAGLAARGITEDDPAPDLDEDQQQLLARYVDAFERYDIEELTTLLAEDALQSMPPFALWVAGRDEVFRWWLGPGIGCKGSRCLPTAGANGRPAFGQYKPDPNGGYSPWSLMVVEIEGDKVVELTFFLDTKAIFPLFDLPPHLD